MPAAAMASLTRATRPGAAAITRRQTASWTWWKSAISPRVRRRSARPCPATPGSRWSSPRWALNRWVTMRAPASAAAATTAARASECPTETTTPASTSRATAAIPPGRSGARVVTASTPSPASSSRPTAAGEGSSMAAGSWAPGLAGERNGPSAWTPRTRAPRPSRPRAARAPASEPASWSSGAVMKVGRNEVTPVVVSAAVTRAQPAASAPARSTPAKPLTCRSTRPGTSTPWSSLRCPGPGAGRWGSTAATRPPSSATAPGLSTRSPVTTRGAETTRSGPSVAAPAPGGVTVAPRRPAASRLRPDGGVGRLGQLAGERRRADHAGVDAELGRPQRHRGDGRQHLAPHGGLERRPQRLTDLHDAATEDDRLGVQCVDQAAERAAEGRARRVQGCRRGLLSGRGAPGHRPHVDPWLAAGALVGGGDAGRGHDRLQVAGAAAGAAHLLGPCDGYVAQLAGGAGGAAQHPAVADDRPAEAGADDHQQERPEPAAGAVACLAQRGGVDVVVGGERQAEAALQLGRDRGPLPAGEVAGGSDHHAAPGVDHPGRADAASARRVGGEHPGGQVGGRLDHGDGPLLRRGRRHPPGDHGPVGRLDHRDRDLGPADVHPEQAQRFAAHRAVPLPPSGGSLRPAAARPPAAVAGPGPAWPRPGPPSSTSAEASAFTLPAPWVQSCPAAPSGGSTGTPISTTTASGRSASRRVASSRCQGCRCRSRTTSSSGRPSARRASSAAGRSVPGRPGGAVAAWLGAPAATPPAPGGPEPPMGASGSWQGITVTVGSCAAKALPNPHGTSPAGMDGLGRSSTTRAPWPIRA